MQVVQMDVHALTYSILLQGGLRAFAEEWMFADLRASLAAWQEVVLHDDLDYSAALLQSNAHYQVWRT